MAHILHHRCLLHRSNRRCGGCGVSSKLLRLYWLLSRFSLHGLTVRRFGLLPKRLCLLVGDGFQAGDVVVCIIVYLETNLSIIP